MKDEICIQFLQWALPQMQLCWQGFRRVRKQLCKRISRRIAMLNLADALAYRNYLYDNPSEWQNLAALCRVTISSFYRDQGVFNQLANKLIPRLCDQLLLQGEKNLRCWSAGCARGEEAYSLVLLWSFSLHKLYPEIQLNITATDIDPVMIQQARQACYPFSSVRNLLPEWRQAAFMKIDDQYCLGNMYRRSVNFLLADIEHAVITEPYHVVLCRNVVFTYFNTSRQVQFLNRLQKQLISGGVLVLGAHERLPGGVSGWCQWRQQLPIYLRE